MATYKAVLFSVDGDYVTDFPRETIGQVREALADRGSRWYFFPYEGVIRGDTSTILLRRKLVDVAPELEEFKGCYVKTVARVLRELASKEG